MKCHICEKEPIEDVGIFLEPICADCMRRHGDAILKQFYEQTMHEKVMTSHELGTNAFTEEAFNEYIEAVKNNNRGYSPDVIFRSKV